MGKIIREAESFLENGGISLGYDQLNQRTQHGFPRTSQLFTET